MKRELVEDIIPLTYIQKCMFLKSRINPLDDCYYEQCHYKVTGRINIDLISKTWEHIAETHDVLRSVIAWEEVREPVFIIYKNYKIPISITDLRNSPNKKEQADEIAKRDWKEKVDLCGCPYKVSLILLRDNEVDMIVNTHHILIDGWSNAIILKHFIHKYIALYENREYPVKKYRIKDVMKFYINQDRTLAGYFWNEYLRGAKNTSFRTAGYVQPNARIEKKYYRQSLDTGLYQEVISFAGNRQMVPAALFYGAWGILLYTLTGSNELIFGITFSGRNPTYENIENAVGIFINTLPLRIEVSENKAMTDYLGKINSDLIVFNDSQHIQFLEVLDNLQGIPQNLFDSVVVIQNYPLDKRVIEEKNAIINIQLYSTHYSPPSAITLGMLTIGKKKYIEFFYDSSLFTENKVEEICCNYVKILRAIMNNDSMEKAVIDFKA